jgi:membrane-bound serine protease (ClpP class)
VTAALLLGTPLLVLGLMAPAVLATGGQPAGSAPTTVGGATSRPSASGPAAGPAPVDVIEVIGWIDEIEASFIARSLATSEREGSQLLVIQLDSPGSLLSDQKLSELTFRISHSGIPVGVWVGPTGSRAYGGAVRLVRAAATSGMATGTRVGRFRGECALCPPGDPLLTGASLSADEAARREAVGGVAPTLGDFIVEQHGRQVGGRQLETARVVTRDGTPRREPVAQVRFAKLGLLERLWHATTSPQLAYLLLVLGLLLIVFEFFSAGIGLASLTGAGSLVLSAYGLGALGARPLALALVALAIFGFSVDVQAGAPRVWTVIGTVALLLGSWLLFPADRRVGWPAIVVVLIGTVLFMVRGMVSMVRARFSTATIGRESMIGEQAEATTAIDPEGMVRLRGALWRARVNRATPIAVGDPVRVVGIDGLVLEVAPQPTSKEGQQSSRD